MSNGSRFVSNSEEAGDTSVQVLLIATKAWTLASVSLHLPYGAAQ